MSITLAGATAGAAPGSEADTAPYPVVMGHTYYRDLGGENLSFEAEVRLLRDAGHPVIMYTRDNREINGFSHVQKAAQVWRTTWADDTYRELMGVLRRQRPAVAHFQNTFPLISPSAYWACRRRGVPVVQSLRNFRLICSNALFFRDGHVCEDCMGKTPPLPGVVHACYRSSRSQTAVVAAMLTAHRILGSWQDLVDVYVVPAEFGRQKFIEAGLPADRIVVKPNFVDPDPGTRVGEGTYGLFVGRLAREKGVLTLLDAWQRHGVGIPLKIVGDGPLRDVVEQRAGASRHGEVEFLGHRSQPQVFDLMKGARFVLFPSQWYETFGRVAVEAFACGVPVVASRMGTMAEVVTDGVTGLHFEPGDAADLAEKVTWAIEHPSEFSEMGVRGRAEYEANYTAPRNYEMLRSIYDRAIEHARTR